MRTLEKGHHQHFCIVVSKSDIVIQLWFSSSPASVKDKWIDDTKTTMTMMMRTSALAKFVGS